MAFVGGPSGMFDLMLIVALSDGWPEYSGNVAAFIALFPGLDPALVADWHAVLTTEKREGEAPVTGVLDLVDFRAAFAPGKTQLPGVFTKYDGQPADENFLDDFLGLDEQARECTGGIEKETVTLYVVTGHPEITRALHVAVKAVVYRARRFFHDLGFEGLSYTGGGDLRPQEDLMPELLGNYVRTMTWIATSITVVPDVQLSKRKIIAASTDVTVGGIDGGVEPTGGT